MLLSVLVLGGAGGASQLPNCETVRRRRAVCFCFGAGGGPVSFRAVKGKGGESALVLVLGGAGGPGCEGEGG